MAAAAALNRRACSSSSSSSRLGNGNSSSSALITTAAAPRIAVLRSSRRTAPCAAQSSGAGEWPWRAPDYRALQAAAPASEREAERSAMVNEEAVFFIFQLELDAQLQRALNYESYEAAQQIRAKRETVDLAIRQMAERKSASAAAGGAAAAAAGAALESIDITSEGLQLRSEMQRAVEEERYADAARCRDLLAELEKRGKRAAADAAAGAPSAGGAPLLRLGQRVVHRRHGYRGVVIGWDAACCEGDEWVARSGARELAGGLQQRYYHVLVDARDWAFDAAQPPAAYVAEELLAAPALTDNGATWAEVYGAGDELKHPYSYVLFLGPDAAGDLVPTRQLRDKYGAPRRDVRRPGSGDGDGGDGEDAGGGGGGEGREGGGSGGARV